jgi:subtilisin family serine protease
MMRSFLVVVAAMTATVVSGGPVAAAGLHTLPPASLAAKLRLSPAEIARRHSSKVYIVQMAAKPAVSYQGDIAGYARTAATAGQRYNAHTSQAQMYVQRLERQHDMLLASVGASNSKIYSYVHAFNGFAAKLTPAQVAQLHKSKSVLKVWADQRMAVDTNNTPRFLGLLNKSNGLRGALGLTGEGVIIGMIDTGAVQEHPSFADNHYDAPPAQWAGICQAGQGWSINDCSNKLIGARWFAAGFSSSTDFAAGEFLSARDSDGHGTHTASTAGGNRVKATLNGTPIAPISGMAYRARLAIYKACWAAPNPNDSGCFFSDTAAAADAAVADGVDVINFSVGTDPAFDDPMDLALLGAFDAGIFVARSAGNEGPGPGSVAAGEPWDTSVAASTHRGTAYAQAMRVNTPAAVAGDYASLEGAITKPLVETGDITDDVSAADPIEACGPIAATSGIVLIARGTCTFTEKVTNAVNAGADAVLVYSQDGNPKTVMGGTADATTMSIPGVMVDFAVGDALLTQINAAQTVNATLSASVFVPEQLTGNIMADFSSRGPYPTVPGWIKPDVSAPGVRILAGATPEPNDGSAGDFFQYLQGTSMASPHVAGIGALLREAHPDWTPAMIKSSLMTTARQNLKKEDGATRADPFDIGAGHIVPNLAVDPGLVYDSDLFGHLAATCGTDTPLVVADDCDFLESLGYSLDAADLNLPSIGADGVVGSKTVHRTVTNVSDAAATYTVSVQQPPQFRVDVNPTSLTLQPGESATYEVRIRNRVAPAGVWRFGSLTWTDGTHVVRSPIAVNAQVVLATSAVAGEGADGSASVDVTFGFNGPYTAGAHGLVEPNLSLFEVTDDPNNSFDFDFGDDEPLVYLADAPEGAAALQFRISEEYNDQQGHDLDLYVFYCPDFVCTQVGASLTGTSNEVVRIPLPQSDPSIDDPYAVFIHGYNTVGGAPASGIFFDWTADEATGNMTVDPSDVDAHIGQSTTLDVNWTGLATGPGEKWFGAVSHSDASGPQGVTYVDVENDAGGGYCDFVDCGP